MPPKRKIAVTAEQSPSPKKVAVESTSKGRRKRSLDIDPSTGATVVATKKQARKKVAIAEEESVESPATVEKVEQLALSTTTPKQVRKKKSAIDEDAATFVVIGTKANITPASKTPLNVDSRPASTKKTPSRSSKKTPSSSAIASAVGSTVLSAKESAIPEQIIDEHSKVLFSTSHEVEVVELTDGKEILGIWAQTWTALNICITTIAPLFLIAILGCYTYGKMNDSQVIASVGLVYAYVFLVIIGSYALVIVPFILISRLITTLVAPTSNRYTPEQINNYFRLLLLIFGSVALLVFQVPALRIAVGLKA